SARLAPVQKGGVEEADDAVLVFPRVSLEAARVAGGVGLSKRLWAGGPLLGMLVGVFPRGGGGRGGEGREAARGAGGLGFVGGGGGVGRRRGRAGRSVSPRGGGPASGPLPPSASPRGWRGCRPLRRRRN